MDGRTDGACIRRAQGFHLGKNQTIILPGRSAATFRFYLEPPPPHKKFFSNKTCSCVRLGENVTTELPSGKSSRPKYIRKPLKPRGTPVTLPINHFYGRSSMMQLRIPNMEWKVELQLLQATAS